MSREAYDRVRRATEGTALAGRMESLNTELHLTPSSPEWSIAALALIGTQPLIEALQATTDALTALASSLPDRMNAAAGEILRGIRPQLEAVVRDIAVTTGQATRAAVTAVVRDDMQDLMTASGEHLGRSLGAFERSSGSMRDAHDKSAGEMINASHRLLLHVQSLHDHTFKVFLLAVAACLALALASAGLTYWIAYPHIYHSGYASGAYVERAALGARH